MEGLKDDVLRMLAGGRAVVNVRTFYVLIHLDYLGHDAEMEEVFIPNYEVATAYEVW